MLVASVCLAKILETIVTTVSDTIGAACAPLFSQLNYFAFEASTPLLITTIHHYSQLPFEIILLGDRIVGEIFESTTWVHKADVHKTGFITESDFILFKV